MERATPDPCCQLQGSRLHTLILNLLESPLIALKTDGIGKMLQCQLGE